MTFKIVRNDAGNCINFEGSTNPSYFNACLSGEVAGSGSNLVNVVNDIRTGQTGTTQYEFFNIPYTEFVDANGSGFADAQAAADYITVNGNVTGPSDINAGYKGVYNASTNVPDTGVLEDVNNGDWYWITTSGNGLGLNDQIRYNVATSGWDVVENVNVAVADIQNGSLASYDIYCRADYSGFEQAGSTIRPYNNIQTALDNASDGDNIFIDGEFTISSPLIIPSGKDIHIDGQEGTAIKYASFNAANGAIIKSTGSAGKEISLNTIKFQNAGEYAVDVSGALEVDIKDCIFINNGWSGNRLSTKEVQTDTWDNTGVLGYDSTQSDLQSFWASSETSDGGAILIHSTPVVNVTDCKVYNNSNGILIKDCGVGGAGIVSRTRSYNNIGCGLCLDSSSSNSTNGCENFTVYNNYVANNANNGIVSVGGVNNVISLNRIEGNWNAGFCLSHVSDTRARDMDLDNNNLSEYNGYGTAGDAQASIQVGGNTIRDGYTFLAEILGTTVHNTNQGSSSTKNGLILTSDIATSGKPLINIDDVAFIGQDYAVKCDGDADNIKLTISDCRYTDTEVANVTVASGSFYELPYSNLHVNAKALDFSLDATNSHILIKENSKVIQSYGINELQAVANGSKIRIKFRGSDRIQFDDLLVSSTSINGINVNSVLSNAIVQLNDLFVLNSSFVSNENPVTGFVLSGDDLTITLQDATSYTVDVTSLGVDENKFVSSGVLNGSNLELTMNDSTVVTIDATNMVNGSQLPIRSDDWYVAYGSNAGDEVTDPTVTNTYKDIQPFYNGDFLEKGEEYIWTHDTTGDYMLGVWSGAESVVNYANIFNSSNWSAAFRFVQQSNRFSGSTSVGVDTNTRLSIGDNANVTADGQYDVTNSTALVLRYGQDNHLYLLDVSDGGEFIIGKTNAAIVGDDVTIFFTGGNQPNAKFPVMVKRFEQWTIVHDFDNSENGEWNDGVEADTIIKSNMTISPGEKMLLNFNYFGRSESIGIGYTGASSGVNNAGDDITSYLIYGSAETLKAGDTNAATGGEWTWNQNATAYYNPNGDNSNVGYWNGNGNNLGHFSFVYNNDNSIVLYHEGNGEEMATKTVNADGSDINIYIGFNEAHPVQRIPAISKQDLTAGSQPTTNFAPDISNQTINITEGQAFNSAIVLNSGSDIVNQFVEQDAPNWAVLDQSTGYFSGTAPSYAGSGDAYVVNCKAANVIGGSVDFQVTLNVQEVVYTNTKSLFFGDGDSSYLGGNAALVTSLERAANGSGSTDAWSVMMWYKRGVSSTGQTLFYFGNNDTTNSGFIEVRNTNTDRIRLRYGSNNNYIQRVTGAGALGTDWHCILITYDGGTTGVDSGSLSSYYSRFKIFIDGTEMTGLSNSHLNYGWSGAIVGQNYRFGRFASGNYIKDGTLNQLAIWDSDQSTNASGLYNGGSTQDLSTLSSGVGGLDSNYEDPVHYYEIESSTSTIADIIGTATLVGYNFDSSDLVTDAP